MEVKLISDSQKQSWNDFIIENNGSFLQCLEWGDVQEKLGNKVFRIQAKRGGCVSAQALVTEHKLPLNKRYFYIPYGPCFKSEIALEELFQQIHSLAKKRGAIFLRIEPQRHIDTSKYENSKISISRVQPQKTLILDITKPEQDILRCFSKETRYSIRQAESRRVVAEFDNKYTPEFYRLLKQTSQKSGFKPHPERHYKTFFEVRGADFKPKMCLAKYQGKIIAASIMVLFGKKAAYLHAASDKNLKALQAPSFLLWEQIKLAKSLGCEIFDFWGIDEKKWPGVTNFKKSFGGKEVSYGKSSVIVFSRFWYNAYKSAKRLK